VEPHEYDEIIRNLVQIAAHQDILNEKQDLTNQRLALALERLDLTLQAVKDILSRGNGRWSQRQERSTCVDNQILLEVTRFVSLQSKLLVVMAGAMVVGLVVLGLQLRAVSADLKAIAAVTAEVLRRTPEH
jgi:hypothetical protein